MKRAIISVSNKEGVVPFAQELIKLGYEIISTGGTRKALEAAGVKTIGISDVTGFPEIMDGRVKTLHPKVHGGLLSVRTNPEHVKEMESNGIAPIDMVVVNLYPFKQTIEKEGTTFEDAIENIDIGGPSMLRSAAKNHAFAPPGWTNSKRTATPLWRPVVVWPPKFSATPPLTIPISPHT